MRFELMTPGLRDQCSATELKRLCIDNDVPWVNELKWNLLYLQCFHLINIKIKAAVKLLLSGLMILGFIFFLN